MYTTKPVPHLLCTSQVAYTSRPLSSLRILIPTPPPKAMMRQPKPRKHGRNNSCQQAYGSCTNSFVVPLIPWPFPTPQSTPAPWVVEKDERPAVEEPKPIPVVRLSSDTTASSSKVEANKIETSKVSHYLEPLRKRVETPAPRLEAQTRVVINLSSIVKSLHTPRDKYFCPFDTPNSIVLLKDYTNTSIYSHRCHPNSRPQENEP